MSAPAVIPAAPGARTAPRRSVPASRGRLVLGDRVVEKVAAQAATEVRGVLGREGGVLGVGAHAGPDARPSVDVDLGRESADVALTVGLTYPGSVRRVTSELRDHVAQRVEALTGVAVHRVDVDVRFLVVPGTDGADEPRERLR